MRNSTAGVGKMGVAKTVAVTEGVVAAAMSPWGHSPSWPRRQCSTWALHTPSRNARFRPSQFRMKNSKASNFPAPVYPRPRRFDLDARVSLELRNDTRGTCQAVSASGLSIPRSDIVFCFGVANPRYVLFPQHIRGGQVWQGMCCTSSLSRTLSPRPRNMS